MATKRINKERCCIYYIGFIHSVFICGLFMCGLYLRGYAKQAGDLLDKIDDFVDDLLFIPNEASTFIVRGNALVDYIYESVDNTSGLIHDMQDTIHHKMKAIDDIQDNIDVIRNHVNHTIMDLELVFDYIKFLTIHFSKRDIKKFTDDLNTTLSVTRGIANNLINITTQLQKDVNTILYQEILNNTYRENYEVYSRPINV